LRTTFDSLDAAIKLYNSEVKIDDETQTHPYEIIKNSLNDFLTFPEMPITDSDSLEEYINNNFVLDDSKSTGVNKYYYLKCLNEDNFGNNFYSNRTISSVASQLFLPKTLVNTIFSILNN
jgi:hypothetical protein